MYLKTLVAFSDVYVLVEKSGFWLVFKFNNISGTNVTPTIGSCVWLEPNPVVLLNNVSPLDDGVSVEEIVEMTLKKVKREILVNYEPQEEGWSGDVVKYSYNTDLQKKLGWNPKYSSAEAIEKTISLTFD